MAHRSSKISIIWFQFAHRLLLVAFLFSLFVLGVCCYHVELPGNSHVSSSDTHADCIGHIPGDSVKVRTTGVAPTVRAIETQSEYQNRNFQISGREILRRLQLKSLAVFHFRAIPLAHWFFRHLQIPVLLI